MTMSLEEIAIEECPYKATFVHRVSNILSILYQYCINMACVMNIHISYYQNFFYIFSGNARNGRKDQINFGRQKTLKIDFQKSSGIYVCIVYNVHQVYMYV